MINWHELDKDGIIKELEVSSENGLTSNQVRQRLEEYGKNELVERAAASPWKILLEQFKGTMVVILMISAVVSFVLHEYTDAIVIALIVLLNSLLGFTQEYKAEQAMAALKKLAVPHVKVKRDGHIQELSAAQLVPGDLVILEAGNSVPADGRLIESVNLRCQESVLTGESEAVDKTDQPISQPSAPIAERRNMAYMGTIVTFGRGTLLVTETGMKTQLGKIADLVQSVGRETNSSPASTRPAGQGSRTGSTGDRRNRFFPWFTQRRAPALDVYDSHKHGRRRRSRRITSRRNHSSGDGSPANAQPACTHSQTASC